MWWILSKRMSNSKLNQEHQSESTPTLFTSKLDKYSEHIDWLFHQYPAFQKQGGVAYKPGLSHTFKLFSLFDLEYKKLKYIHVAGTNGKGSVCCIAASMLTEKNHTVGLFTSPHLSDFRERIRVNGSMISEQEVVAFCEVIRNTKLDFKPSFFEISFVMAIRHFINQECDYVVLETGMGGRLDATNVVNPLVSVITNIGMDHQQYLGNTLEDIASEKAGIIKPNVPIVIGEKQEAIHYIFERFALKKMAPVSIPEIQYQNSNLPAYQIANINTAIHTLSKIDIASDELCINKALGNLQRNTGYQKRMETIHDNPTIILDVSHNEAGLKATMDDIRHRAKGDIHCILGSTKERNIDDSFMNIFNEASLSFCEFSNERSKTSGEWIKVNKRMNRSIPIHSDVNSLFNKIKAKLTPDDTLIVTGSFFLLADLKLTSLQSNLNT
jgi:dihydrofolate synthase/folylpolyglutamate synthase